MPNDHLTILRFVYSTFACGIYTKEDRLDFFWHCVVLVGGGGRKYLLPKTDGRTPMVSMSTDANADDNEAEVWKTPLFVLYAKLRV